MGFNSGFKGLMRWSWKALAAVLLDIQLFRDSRRVDRQIVTNRQANSDQSTGRNVTKDINRHETATCFDPYKGHLQVHNNSETDTDKDNVYVVVLIKITENKNHHHHRHHVGAID